MTVDKVEVSVRLPRLLWEQVRQWAKTEQADEATLLTRAIEQFLRQEEDRLTRAEQLARECETLATMTFDDVGDEEAWLIVQNEQFNG